MEYAGNQPQQHSWIQGQNPVNDAGNSMHSSEPAVFSASLPHQQLPWSTTLPKEGATPIDPDLFNTPPEPQQHGGRPVVQHAYPPADPPQPNNETQDPYQASSLEHIANEVLVDLKGNQIPPQTDRHQRPAPQQLQQAQQALDASTLNSTPSAPPGHGSSADSGVSVPPAPMTLPLPDWRAQSDIKAEQESSRGNSERPPTGHRETAAQDAASTSRKSSKTGIDGLPLYRPPAPISKSPENSQRQPVVLTAGNPSRISPPPVITPFKRKRGSVSDSQSAKGKKSRVNGDVPPPGESRSAPASDKESLELAKLLQKEDRGLRQRGPK